ncbi:hypothetical protein HMPREF9422_1475 [Streptococcus cristatus ATCC 51100]|jgi:hypothetical protein|uniref:DUF1700 domain-containing protein n=2 Tax=Streptococcus cristatus TaxID=45634 RepID=A0AAV3EGX5_STRCR|nr:DUF1700 domain-containing protein [Streptococcus cristatus]EFX52335.1 hypothetical protein HMPREF9422_1475 [Streptococcus cristatus ATCC 51100]EGU68416.1 hypothetical protein HMPREF9960_1175 [Streptococcus cristatus ATCC 51100]KJQ60436.1 hypothetical protein TZ85_00491 [Streptococcus cristatus]RSJ72687.1 hypothetical protein D8799_06165 [Streptococcus cristatus]RSJ76486.1 hypothetical protein D8798_05750 [Streptococcus cristatus]
MTRTEYLAQLEKYLKKLPAKDYQEAMDYFTEYFDEVGPEGEAAAIAELGNPKEAAHEIIINLLDKKIEEDSQEASSVKNSKQIVQIAILSILAAPLAIPLLILALTLIFTFFLLVSVLAFVMAVFTFAMLLLGASLIWDSLTLGMATSIPAFALSLGMSFLALGMAGLFYLSIGPILRFIKLSFVKLAQTLARKGDRHV